jgi:hypothetical protein
MLTSIFTRANLRSIPTPSAWHIIIALLVIITLQVAVIAYLVDYNVLCGAAILNAVYAIFLAVRS